MDCVLVRHTVSVCVCVRVRNSSRMLDNIALPNKSYVMASFRRSLFLCTAISSTPKISITLFLPPSPNVLPRDINPFSSVPIVSQV